MIGYSLETSTPFSTSTSLPGSSTTKPIVMSANLATAPTLSRSLAVAILAPAITAPTRQFAVTTLAPAVKPTPRSLDSGVGADPAEFWGPTPTPVGYTQAQADAEASRPPWTLIAAGVGVLAVGAVVALRLKKKR